MVDACRQELNKFIPDVYIYTDHYKGNESGLSPGYGLSLVAETTEGCLFSAERMAEKATMPEELGKASGARQEKKEGGTLSAVESVASELFYTVCVSSPL